MESVATDESTIIHSKVIFGKEIVINVNSYKKNYIR